jgi:hypothetical protein
MSTVVLVVGLAQLVQLSPVAGDQLYVLAPEALKAAVEPEHKVTGAVTASTGNGFTVTVTVFVLTQPAGLVVTQV